MTPDDDTTLTMEKLRRASLAVLEARAIDGDFWARIMATHGVQQVRFSAHLPEDSSQRLESQHAYGFCRKVAFSRVLAFVSH